MEENENLPEALHETLKKLCYKEGEYRLVLTKELRIEPVTAPMRLDSCLPYPITEKTGSCPICGEDYSKHTYMDYFVKPKHIKAIRNFLVLLTEKYDETKNMYLKLGIEAPESVLTPKEMILHLKELAETNPTLANQLIPLYWHFIPSEDFKFQIRSVSRKLMEIKIHYEGLSLKWRTDMRIHETLIRPSTMVPPPEDKVVEKALGVDQNNIYANFLKVHEKDAELDYFDIQSDFHLVTSTILAYEKLMKEFTEMPRYGKLKHALKQRSERPIYFPTPSYGFPTRRRSRRELVL